MFIYCDYMKLKLSDNVLNRNHENTYSKNKNLLRKNYIFGLIIKRLIIISELKKSKWCNSKIVKNRKIKYIKYI